MILILDLQLLQTPALHRGMGQYILSLLKAMDDQTRSYDIEKVHCIFTSKSPITKELKDKVKEVFSQAETVELPLLTLEDTKETKKATRLNGAILTDWLLEKDLQGAAFCIPSVFQAEIYPTFPEHVKKCLIMYDVIPLQMHDVYSKNMRWEDYLCRFHTVNQADAIFSISKTTSNSLQVYFGTSAKKLHVINGGPGDFPTPTKLKKSIPKKYYVMPTGNDIRKNNKNAVLGFESFNRSMGNKYNLVITSFFSTEEKRMLSELCENVIFTGNVTNSELAGLYKNCEAVLFPTLLEGLGMPLLEGLVYNKPVIVSKISVFEEISENIPYYFNPYDIASITSALTVAHEDSNFTIRKKSYKAILNSYSWENTSKSLLSGIKNLEASKQITKKKIAVLCPNPAGISAIGKFAAEMHPLLSEKVDIDYYFEEIDPPWVIRPNIIAHIASTNHVSEFTRERYKEYDEVIYHIGNGKHHSYILMCSLSMPGRVVLHDLNVQGIFEHLLRTKNIDQQRFDAEIELTKRVGTNSRGVTSLVSRQHAVIVHSDHAASIIKKNIFGDSKTEIIRANLPVQTPKYEISSEPVKKTFTIGLAGILANIKGLDVIEKIAQDPSFANDRILLFGINFAEPGSLDRLRKLPNVDVQTSLSDYLFQEKLQDLSVLVNYRTHYQGEASSVTLESMRYGIPVIVRSDFGWYSELPDDSVVKVASEEEILEKLLYLKQHTSVMQRISKSAKKTTLNDFNTEVYIDRIISRLGDRCE